MEAVVEYEYTAEQEDELNLNVGDTLTNVQTAEGGWWEGELNGKKGMFPENFVKLIRRRDPPALKKEQKREATQRKSVRELASKFKDGLPMGAPAKKKENPQKCKVLFEYKKENDDELELATGDIVDFHKQVEEGWWEGTLNGKHGVFPSNFVEMIEDTGSANDAVSDDTENKTTPPEKSADTDGEVHAIKVKKVIGVGLGNIFSSGPIKLRSTAEKVKKEQEHPNPSKSGESESAPEVAKREKQNTLERAVVRFSYGAEQPDELSLVEGETVRIIERELEDEGWWKGEVNGKVGVFPDNFVELIPTEEPCKPKKPPPPAASAKHNMYPKPPEKSGMGDRDEKSKTNLTSAPSIGKKPQPPPPIGKKHIAKPEPVQPVLPARPTASVKDKTSSSRKDVKPPGKENNTPNGEGPEGQFDSIEPSCQKLTHLTANRAKGPKKRPPSTVLTLNEGDMRDEVAEPTKMSHSHHVAEKHITPHEKPPHHPHISTHKESKHQSEMECQPVSAPVSQSSHHLVHSTSHQKENEHSSGPRPPEPSSAPPSSSNSQLNKLIEQLQREMNELRANTVSKSTFTELQAEHQKLKQDLDNFKSQHTKKLRDVTFEVDDEKKLRLTTQVEIERVKKWMAESNI